MEKIPQQPTENPQNLNRNKEMNQGEKASEVFGGKAISKTVEKLYTESTQYFSTIIKNRLKKQEKEYTLADLGSFKGEFLQNILTNLPRYNFNTIAFDLEKNLEENNVASKKVVANLTNLPVADKSIDVVIARYVLVWNNAEKQKQILQEISRSIKEFAVIQHAGADNKNSDEWRLRLNNLLKGEEVSKAKRVGHYFSSREEIEDWMIEAGIDFERIQERRVEDVSNVFIERLALDEKERIKTREILKGKDYIIQTTWIIYPQS